MKITAIITTFNRSNLLPRAIRSVMAQTRKVSEILIVDDSTCERHLNRNKQIVQEYDNSRLVYLKNEKNIGVNPSRNIGLHNANSDFVMFLDDDDEWRNNRVEVLSNSYEDKFSYVTTLNLNKTSAGYHYFRRKSEITLSNILYGNFSGHMPLIKLDRILSLGGFDEQLVSSCDWDMWIRLIETYGSARVIQEPTYVTHDDGAHNSISLSPNKPIGKQQCFDKHKSKMSYFQKRYINNEIRKLNGNYRSLFTKFVQFPIGIPFVEYKNMILGPIKYE